jgi:hypothetical protein
MKRLRGLGMLFLLPILLVSCGYTFPGMATALPGGGTKIAFEPFANATPEPGLVTGIQEAFSLEVAKRGSFEQTSAGRADVVLSGVIESLDIRPVGFSRSDEALQYETVVRISAWLTNPKTGRVVWRVDGLQQSDSYGAAATTVIAQSSEFQENSTLNEADLLRLSDVQVAESQQGDALKKVSDNLARELYNSMVDNF